MGMIDVTEPEKPVTINIQPTAPTVFSEEIYQNDEPKPKKRGRKKKTERVGDVEIVTGKDDDSDLPMLQSNRSYKETYVETDNILRTAIVQLDEAAAELGADIHDIRQSKTMRNKYKYLSDLQSARSSIISTKVSAARELNNSIKNAHELDLKRAKELKLNEENDDVKSIQDMYNAFVSMPVSQNMQGPFQNPLGPTTQNFTLNSGNLLMPDQGQDPEIGYQNYLQNMNQEQMAMMIEDNPNMNHVIAYDPATGNATFAVYDSQTNTFVNAPTRSNEMFMPGVQFDFENMMATSQDLNETYDIVDVNKVNGSVPMVGSTNKDMSNY